MPTPAWIESLRAKAGHDLIMTTAVCAVIVDDEGRVLLQKRADKDRWALPGGILEPGEHLHEALVREVKEETGIDARISRLTGVYASRGVLTHLNGD